VTPRDLREMLAELERRGELAVVRAEVDPFLELPEIHRRVIAAGGPALLFVNVRGSAMPVVTNLFGTRERALLAVGDAPVRVQRLTRLLSDGIPPRWSGLWRARRDLLRVARAGLRRVRRGPVTEVVEREPDLGRWPALTCWPGDGGPFLTLPLVYTEPPGGGPGNLGIYRMQVHGPRLLGMHWQIGKGGGFHHGAAESRGEPLPVTVTLGGPPALILAAIAPLPENVPELLLASFLLGRRLRVVRSPAGHPLAADAELAIVGRVPCDVRHPEGPFGDHYGYYSLRHDYPVLEVEAVFRRRDAIYPATVVGKPRQEDFFLGDLLQELLAPLFPLAMPGVVELWAYGETGYHALAAAVVRERYRREALTAALRILGEGQLALTKFLLVTDRPVDLRDFRATLEHVLARARFETDLYVLADTAMDTLDYTGPEPNRGSKGVLLGLGDPVRKLPREFRGELPSGFSRAIPFAAGCLVVEGPSFAEDPEAPRRLAAGGAVTGWPLVVLTDDARRAAASAINFLWTTFTRFEPARDLHAAGEAVQHNHVVRTPPLVVDARMKPWYPEELRCDPETARRVSRRWSEYFPDGGVEMGDAERAHLDPPLPSG